MSALERNAQVPAPTPHKILGPGSTGEESREAPEQLAWGLAFPEATRAGPCGPRRKLRAPAATQEVPRHTRLHSSGSTRVPPTSRGAPFPPHSSREGIFPCVVGKEFPGFPSHLKRRRSPQERREELQGRATIPRAFQMSQSIPGKPVFPALPRLSSGGSTHTTVARGTALWESLVGKPGGKTSLESLEGKPQIP